MVVTVAINLWVVRYETREARRLGSEVLLADALQTRGDVWTSLAVIAALAGARLGWPILDPLAALVVAGFIGYAGFQIATTTARILSDEMVMSESRSRSGRDERPGRARLPSHPDARIGRPCVPRPARLAAAGHAPLKDAHALSHVVKDRLMARYPQIADAIIHIEPPPR